MVLSPPVCALKQRTPVHTLVIVAVVNLSIVIKIGGRGRRHACNVDSIYPEFSVQLPLLATGASPVCGGHIVPQVEHSLMGKQKQRRPGSLHYQSTSFSASTYVTGGSNQCLLLGLCRLLVCAYYFI